MTLSHEALEEVSPMPRRTTSRTRTTAAAVSPSQMSMPDALRTTLHGAEALSIGLMHALTGTVATAVRGAQEVGAEIGTTALTAVRGSIRAAGEIGGDLGRLALNATSGAVDAGRGVGGGFGRVAVGAAQGAANAVGRAGAGAARMVGLSASSGRRPARKIERPRRRRARRASAA